jgi:hypothetical protein
MADDLRFVISVDDRDLIRTQREQKKFQANLVLIEKAFRDGKISAFRYNTEIVKQSSQLSKLGGTYQKAASEVRTYAASLRKATDAQLANTAATVMGGKKVNRFGMISQQVGYQVGDFFVQVQSGTSALVAFGQQGTQLAGLLPGIYGAVIGIGLAIGTMLARSFLQAKDAMSDFQDLSNSFAPAMKKLSEGIKDTRLEVYKLVTGIKDTNQAIGQQALEYQKALQQTNQFLAAQDGLSRIQKVRAQGLKVFGLTIVKSDQERVDLLEKQNDEYSKLNDRAEQLRKKEEDRKNFLEDQLELEKKILGAGKDILDQESAQSLAASIAIANEEDKLSLLRDRAAGTMTAAEAEEEALRQKLRLEYFLLDNADDLIERRIEQLREERSLSEELKEQLRILKLQEEYLTVTQRVQEGSPAARAMRKYAGRGTVSDKDPIFGTGPNAGKSIYDDPDAGKTFKSTKDEVARLQAVLDLRRQLIGKTQEEAIYLQTLNKLKKANEDADIKMTDTALENAAKRIASDEIEIQKLEDQQQTLQDLASYMGSAYGDALMNIVTDIDFVNDSFEDMAYKTENIFRQMAADIIKELYRVLVVKQMVASATGFLPFANGGVIQGGKQVQAYANGGVVGGPTYFPMAGGKTGLMGEAGPEAIMPLKRGKGGKLGVEVSGDTGSVNIVQNFSFAANGDESVKKIIAEAAPKIANMTQQQIMDARRRGGQMRSTFG